MEVRPRLSGGEFDRKLDAITEHNFPGNVRRKRDDNMRININRSLAVSEWENETLEMTKVSRLDIAAFLCIASVT